MAGVWTEATIESEAPCSRGGCGRRCHAFAARRCRARGVRGDVREHRDCASIRSGKDTEARVVFFFLFFLVRADADANANGVGLAGAGPSPPCWWWGARRRRRHGQGHFVPVVKVWLWLWVRREARRTKKGVLVLVPVPLPFFSEGVRGGEICLSRPAWLFAVLQRYS